MALGVSISIELPDSFIPGGFCRQRSSSGTVINSYGYKYNTMIKPFALPFFSIFPFTKSILFFLQIPDLHTCSRPLTQKHFSLRSAARRLVFSEGEFNNDILSTPLYGSPLRRAYGCYSPKTGPWKSTGKLTVLRVLTSWLSLLPLADHHYKRQKWLSGQQKEPAWAVRVKKFYTPATVSFPAVFRGPVLRIRAPLKR